MNNSQFRKLVLDTPSRPAGSGESNPSLGGTPRRDGATPSALGSRMRSSIPMTPRSIAAGGGVDFARQLAERERNASGGQPQKKFRSMAAPKGSKLAAGYTDRTQMRTSAEDDGKAARVKALEEMMKLQQIDEETFIKLRDEILGGDVASTHLVKGLDFKLLERVRRGEDVLNGTSSEESKVEDEDVDDEFEELEDMEVKAIAKEKTVKKGEMAPPSLVPGKKRTRDQILAELKASREAAKAAAAPALGEKFRKIGAPRSSSRIERDSKGREVLITIDENGKEKRKVRKAPIEEETPKGHGLLMPDKDAKPLGMEVPEIVAAPEEDDEDINIFDDAGDDYDPLAGLDDEDEDSEAEDGELPESKKSKTETEMEKKPVPGSMAPPPRPKPAASNRNYFGESKSDETPESAATPKAFSDPTILAALKKASSLAPIAKSAAEYDEEAAKEAKRKRMLQIDTRDDEDMDMGFGSSRFEDEADFEEKKVKLSEWGNGGDDDDEEGGKEGGKGKRKRGPKKRKGDSNSAADVMKVLERRKAADS
ncbi:hypothetical protein BP5796_05886 [Coleophoma crateriformis]|uniref:RED-like N-terminal domain-containing protein n=1 Tax=Coleophoma crateriformis TaxID=565419 RepID=A0A3D8RVZ5_9HELO|nr:hypothetical protein BP5796_05886 [Coleophoma crateriformis]